MLLNRLSASCLALSLLAGVSVMIGPAAAQQSTKSIMVAGDSISAGWGMPSYRRPLLDSLSDYGCPVSMLGDQTQNEFSYRVAAGPNNGTFLDGFSPANGYDTDHQAFPGITTDQFAEGVANAANPVLPISSYISGVNPDFVLLHLGSNDMGGAFASNRLSTDTEVNGWANTTLNEMNDVIDGIVSGHNQPSALRILVANFIPYASDSRTAAQLVHAKRASKLFTDRLESMVLDRADANILIVDVATGFDSADMTYDGLHPDANGEEHLAGAFLPILRGAGLCPTTPMVTAPALGSTVNGDSTMIEWTNNGLPAVSGWRVRVGRSQSGTSSTYFDSGDLPGNTRSVNVTGLPADQQNLFVSLQFTDASGTDMVLSSFINRAAAGGQGTPEMSWPLDGSALPGSTVQFTWETNDFTVRQWYVRVGSTPGGTEYFDSDRITDKSTRSVTVSGLPTDGSTVYLELSARPTVDPWNIKIFTYRAAGGGLPEKVLQSNEWYQVSLPFDPGSNNRVRDIFGDALPVDSYGIHDRGDNWVVVSHELDPVSQLNDTFSTLALNDRLLVGRGYWVLHQLPTAVTLRAPSGAGAISSNVTSAQRAACENPGRCYAVLLDATVTDGERRRSTMLGYPLSNPTDSLKIRVGTSRDPGCSGELDCSLIEAERNDLMLDSLVIWNSDIGVEGSYQLIGPLKGVLNPWDGFWASVFSAARGQNASLIMSEPANGN